MSSSSLPPSFDELLQAADRPILVDFWAEWCPPCRALTPVLNDIAKEFKGRLFIVKVNTDQKPHLAARYGIQSIPTLILFRKGRILWRGTGALPMPALRKVLLNNLESAS